MTMRTWRILLMMRVRMLVVTGGTGLLRMMKTTREGCVADMKNTLGR
jgi:hypothetical protein